MGRLTLAEKAARLLVDQAFRVRPAMEEREPAKPLTRQFILAAIVLLFGLPREAAWAAEGLDLTLAQSRLPDQQTAPAIENPVGGASGFAGALAAWEAWVARARATQPNWSPPLVTTTGLLEQRARFDVDLQPSGNGTSTTNI